MGRVKNPEWVPMRERMHHLNYCGHEQNKDDCFVHRGVILGRPEFHLFFSAYFLETDGPGTGHARASCWPLCVAVPCAACWVCPRLGAYGRRISTYAGSDAPCFPHRSLFGNRGLPALPSCKPEPRRADVRTRARTDGPGTAFPGHGRQKNAGPFLGVFFPPSGSRARRLSTEPPKRCIATL